MCKRDGETINRLLLLCAFAREQPRSFGFLFIWSFLGHSLLGARYSSLLRGGFKGHQIVDVWNAIPLCLMWCIWKEHNSSSFEGVESSCFN
jgi:hypothetical protein